MFFIFINGVMVILPSYNRNGRQREIEHYRDIVESVSESSGEEIQKNKRSWSLTRKYFFSEGPFHELPQDEDNGADSEQDVYVYNHKRSYGSKSFDQTYSPEIQAHVVVNLCGCWPKLWSTSSKKSTRIIPERTECGTITSVRILSSDKMGSTKTKNM